MSTVLLVEDDQSLRLIYRLNLESGGLTVIEAEDGPTALQLARQTPPEAALLDILLPGMNGLSVAAELARGEETARTAIVFLSALPQSPENLRELERVAIPYYEKPLLDPSQLPALLSKVIEVERSVDRDLRCRVFEQLANHSHIIEKED